MRNLTFRVLAGLLGLGSLLACFKAVVDLDVIAFVYLFVGSLFLIFAFGGYKATDWADYYMNRAADRIANFFSK